MATPDASSVQVSELFGAIAASGYFGGANTNLLGANANLDFHKLDAAYFTVANGEGFREATNALIQAVNGLLNT